MTLDDKEDFERTVRFYVSDGSVVRYEFLTFKTRCYDEPGGMQLYRTPETVKQGALKLAEMYPDLAEAYLKSNGKWEVRLKDRRTRTP